VSPSPTRPAARRKPARIQRTAYHEAGHAVAAYLRHWRFTGISIVPDRYTLGRCFFSQREIVLRTSRMRETRARLETLIVISLAGPAAERLISGRTNRRGALDDVREAEAYASCVAGSEEELRAYMQWLWEFTNNLIGAEPHWSAVKALAAELVARGQVGERRAREVIRDALLKRATPARRRRKRRVPLHG
jgi:hypothetical protein